MKVIHHSSFTGSPLPVGEGLGVRVVHRSFFNILMIIRAILEWDEEAQSYSATCRELNFVSSFGETAEAAIENLKDAIVLMLEPIPDLLLDAD